MEKRVRVRKSDYGPIVMIALWVASVFMALATLVGISLVI